MATTDEILVEERRFFQENRASLLQRYSGKFVLIKGHELLGVFDSPDFAYAEGLKRLGNVPMLVVQVLPEDPVARFPALQLGLVRADIQV